MNLHQPIPIYTNRKSFHYAIPATNRYAILYDDIILSNIFKNIRKVVCYK